MTTAPADTGSGESTIWLWRPDRTPSLKEVWRVPGRLEGIGRASWPDETNRQRSVLVLALDQELQVRQQREQFGRIVLLANDGFD